MVVEDIVDNPTISPLVLSEESLRKLSGMSFREIATVLEYSRRTISWGSSWPTEDGYYLVGQIERSGKSRVLEWRCFGNYTGSSLVPCLISGPYTEEDRLELWYQVASVGLKSKFTGLATFETAGRWPRF